MPRIRTIKPEFWDSPGTAEASHVARLFFIAMWNWADDWGVGLATPKPLIGFAFPNDEDISTADFPSLAKEVAKCFDVEFYEVSGRRYYSIPSWDIHQRTERKAKRLNPGPDQAETHTNTGKSEQPSPTADFPTEGTEVQAWEREQGKGKGNIGKGTGEQAPAVLDAIFTSAWADWPKKTDRADARKKFGVAAKKIGAYELAGFISSFGHAYATTTEKQFIPGLGTWLNRERWTDEMPTAPTTKRDTRQTPTERAQQTLTLATEIDMKGIE